MTVEIQTNFSSAELTQLAGTLAGRPMSRASDRSAAIIRLHKLLKLYIGSALTEKDVSDIFGAVSLEMAEKKLRYVIAKTGNSGTTQEKVSEDEMAKALKSNEPIKSSKMPASKGKPEKAPKEPGDKKRGRESALAGKVLTAVKDENHRREGTGGYKTFAIILKHPGITVEDCIAKGGRMVDIRWDIDRKHLTAK